MQQNRGKGMHTMASSWETGKSRCCALLEVAHSFLKSMDVMTRFGSASYGLKLTLGAGWISGVAAIPGEPRSSLWSLGLSGMAQLMVQSHYHCAAEQSQEPQL